MIPWWHLAERRGMLGLEICGRGRARRTSQSSVSGCRRRRLQLWTSWRVVAAAVGRHCLGTLAFVIKTRAGRRGQDKPGLFRLRLRPWRGITWPHWSCKQNMVAVTDETKLEAHRIGRHPHVGLWSGRRMIRKENKINVHTMGREREWPMVDGAAVQLGHLV
jgi:hypothetical protein